MLPSGVFAFAGLWAVASGHPLAAVFCSLCGSFCVTRPQQLNWGRRFRVMWGRFREQKPSIGDRAKAKPEQRTERRYGYRRRSSIHSERLR
jgi:hypothetical protein